MQGGMGSRIAAAALAALALAAVAAAPANAARGMEIGLQDDPHFLDKDAGVRGAAFAHARSLRASSLRANVAWASVVSDPAAKTAPAVVSFDFSRFDRLIDEAASNGIRVQLTLTGDAPAWATRDRKISDDHPDPQRYAEFAAAAASHFNGRVRALSIWNEPNWHGLLKPERLRRKVSKKVKGKSVRRRVRVCVKTSARVYRELYRAAHAAIKRVAPGMPVWIGETNPYVNRRKKSTAPLAWVRQVACADPVIKRCKGGALRADGYAHHPYSFDRRPGAARPGADNVTLATLGRLSKLLRSYAAGTRGRRVAVPDRVRLLLRRPAEHARAHARRLDAGGVRARAEGAEGAPAPLLPAGRPRQVVLLAHGADHDARLAPPGLQRAARVRHRPSHAADAAAAAIHAAIGARRGAGPARLANTSARARLCCRFWRIATLSSRC